VTTLREVVVTPVSSIEARLLDDGWPWAYDNRDRIEGHWRRLTAANPALYKGRVLIRRAQTLVDGRLSLGYVETDYASFIAFRDFEFPDATSGNSFAMAALRASDGAYVLGEMAAHTANAGKVYFPAGTPDPDDVLPDGIVDLAGSVLRELQEETGLEPDEVEATDKWDVTFAGGRTAMMREVRVPMPAEALQERIRAFIAREKRPELADARIVRGFEDIDAEAMPVFMQGFLRFALKRDQR
jgi:8-oxo-dGTP pyrophosphatase MutT (NUDIX family)